MLRTAVVVFGLAAVGCAELGPRGPRSVGLAHDGWLDGGERIADSGPGFVRARPGEETAYGVSRLVRGLARGAASVAATHPGGAPLKVGDLSAPSGGEHARHGSHRTGRDADLGFFVTDATGRSLPGRAASFDRHGVARDGDGTLVRFDTARNWALVRALVLDSELRVQWIFCSHGVKTLLLRHAAEYESDPDVISRAVGLLHQPSQARSHDDHFHVRVACSALERATGCVDRGPLWPHLRAGTELDLPQPREDDAALFAWMRETELEEP